MGSASTPDFADLVAAVWAYYRLSTSDVRADRLIAESTRQAALEEVHRIAREDDLVVPMLVALAAAAPDEAALCYLGASVMEDLLVHRTGVVLDRIEGAARRDERFRTALTCVAWDDEAVRARFQKPTGGR